MILYIDTSSNFLYTGIVDNNKLIAEIKKEFGHNLSEVALPEIVSMFEENKISSKDIDKIIVVNGPGSFTGIRIGITIAKVYAWSLNVPITTITSLEAMAISKEEDIPKVPIIDARRGYCYAAIFNSDNKEILKPSYLTYEELQKELDKIENYIVITNDEEKLKVTHQNTTIYTPNILEVVNYFKTKKEINPHAINPEYLKLTEAEENKKNDSKN